MIPSCRAWPLGVLPKILRIVVRRMFAAVFCCSCLFVGWLIGVQWGEQQDPYINKGESGNKLS